MTTTRLQKINKRFETIDFLNMKSVVDTLPFFKKELIRLQQKGEKSVSKKVEIENFNLWTPYKDKQLYKQTELILEPRKRHAIFGHNGCGKSTLFRAMANGSLFDQGFPKHVSVLHMQEIETSPDNGSILQTVLDSHELLYCLRKGKQMLDKVVEASSTKDEYKGIQEWYQLELDKIKSDTAEERISKMLKPLGFSEKAQQKNVNELSGGLRMRVALVCAFFQNPDLLLLDEPTNHLDFPSVLWLENRLRAYSGSFLLVTHDRQLLENVCNSVLLIRDKEIKYYKCDFKTFEKRKSQDDKKTYEERERFVQRHRNPDPSTPLGKRVYRYKDWIREYAAQQVKIGDMFTFPDPSPLPDIDESTHKDDIHLISMKDVTFKYPSADTFVFEKKTNCVITAGTRMGIMGPNGAGKSTFLKLLTGKLIPTTGECTTIKGFKLAYFGQHSAEELDLDMTPFEWMCNKYPDVKQTGKLRHHLKKAGMQDEMSDTRMIGFSGGQKARVIFAQLTYECPHLLIMDEPTNFLDLESVDSLITACNKYKGAMLLVTHSRHMLHSCGNIYLSITPGQFKFFDNISDCEKATYRFIKDIEEGTRIKIKSVQGGSSELKSNENDGEESEEEEFTQEAIIKKRQEHRQKIKDIENEEKNKNNDLRRNDDSFQNQKDDEWAVGDECFAYWYEDSHFYKASVIQISKKCKTICVRFQEYGNSVVLHSRQIIRPNKDGTKPNPTIEFRKECYKMYKEQQKRAQIIRLQKKEKREKERLVKKQKMMYNKNRLDKIKNR